jgi:urease accessory protein
MAIVLTHRLAANSQLVPQFTLSLSAEERTRSRYYFQTMEGEGVYLRLTRGTVLQNGDLLQSEDGEAIVQVVAKPEPVMTVRAHTSLELLRAAYHLGNRHIALELAETYVRLVSDPVLKDLIQQMGLFLTEEVVPFQPEAGAYRQASEHHAAHHHTHPAAHSH